MKKRFKVFGNYATNIEIQIEEWFETLSPNAEILDWKQTGGNGNSILYITFLYTDI